VDQKPSARSPLSLVLHFFRVTQIRFIFLFLIITLFLLDRQNLFVQTPSSQQQQQQQQQQLLEEQHQNEVFE